MVATSAASLAAIAGSLRAADLSVLRAPRAMIRARTPAEQPVLDAFLLEELV
jgi:hypothetical protein